MFVTLRMSLHQVEHFHICFFRLGLCHFRSVPGVYQEVTHKYQTQTERFPLSIEHLSKIASRLSSAISPIVTGYKVLFRSSLLRPD